MKVNLTQYSLIFTIVCLTLFTITTSTVLAGDSEDFVARLQKHYQKAPQLEVFALNYHYLGREDPEEAWDYQKSTFSKMIYITFKEALRSIGFSSLMMRETSSMTRTAFP